MLASKLPTFPGPRRYRSSQKRPVATRPWELGKAWWQILLHATTMLASTLPYFPAVTTLPVVSQAIGSDVAAGDLGECARRYCFMQINQYVSMPPNRLCSLSTNRIDVGESDYFRSGGCRRVQVSESGVLLEISNSELDGVKQGVPLKRAWLPASPPMQLIRSLPSLPALLPT